MASPTFSFPSLSPALIDLDRKKEEGRGGKSLGRPPKNWSRFYTAPPSLPSPRVINSLSQLFLPLPPFLPERHEVRWRRGREGGGGISHVY